MESEPAWFGKRLKEMREQNGLTQRRLADKVGLSLRAITYFESGTRLPTWDVVLALAKALGQDCTAFTQQPAEREPARPGRPPKSKDEAEEDNPKRPQGRPKKSRE
jgi:transcriptional regulator with XRE-family HTH domain